MEKIYEWLDGVVVESRSTGEEAVRHRECLVDSGDFRDVGNMVIMGTEIRAEDTPDGVEPISRNCLGCGQEVGTYLGGEFGEPLGT